MDTFDDGSTLQTFDDGSMLSTDSTGSVYSATDAAEAASLSGAYPATGEPWWSQASMLGVSRAIDAVSAGITNIKGAMAAPYAGQNGVTYASGTSASVAAAPASSGLGMLLVLGVVAFALLGG